MNRFLTFSVGVFAATSSFSHVAGAGDFSTNTQIIQALSNDRTTVRLVVPVSMPGDTVQVFVDAHRADSAPWTFSAIADDTQLVNLDIPLSSPSIDVTINDSTSQRQVHLAYEMNPLWFTPAGSSPLVAASTGMDYPSDRTEWIGSENEIQGLAHDPANWYVANKQAVYKIPLKADFNNLPTGYPSFRIPRDLAAQYGHIGDVDFFNGMLYVPLEGGEPLISIVDGATMTEKGRTVLAPRGDTGEVPWVAVNPLDGKVTSSTFNISAAPLQQVRVYSLDRSLKAQLDHTVVLADAQGSTAGNVRVSHAQGGAFSPEGHFYVASDAQDGGSAACYNPQADALRLGCHGIYAFGPEELITDQGGKGSANANSYGVPAYMRKLLFFTPVARQTKHIHLLFTTIDASQEIEGLDIFALAPGTAPGISGMIHLMMSHANSGMQHSFWFKHYDAQNFSARWWF